MRFKELDLRAFGPFTDRLIPFGGDPRVDLIYGPNEAGKSTALRAITGFLFGIEARTHDAHLHDMGSLRIAATIEGPDGNSLSLVRRKGNKNTLLDEQGEPVDEAVLQTMLGGVTRELFLSSFGLDHRRLEAAGRELAAGGGDLKQTLFGAGLGRGVREVISLLGKQADEIWKPTGKKPLLNQSVSRYKAARAEVSRLSLRPAAWKRLSKDQAAAVRESEELTAEIEALEAERSAISRKLRLLPLVAALDARTRERAALGTPPSLDPDAPRLRQDAERDMDATGPKCKRLEKEIAENEQKLKGLVVPGTLLEQERAIKALQDSLAIWGKAMKDRPKRVEALSIHKGKIEEALQALGSVGTELESSGFTIEAGRAARIRKLLQDRTLLDKHREHLDGKLRDAVRKLESDRADLGALPVATDDAELEHVQELADGAAGLPERIRSLAADQEQRVRELSRMCAALPLVTGEAEALAALKVPSSETVERYRDLFKPLEKRLEQIQLEMDSVRNKIDGLEPKLRGLLSSGSVPSLDDLIESRAHRDRGWSLIKQAWLEGVDISEAESAYDPDLPLSRSFERNLENTDEVADRLRVDADRVAQLAEIESQSTEFERQLKQLSQRLEETQGEKEALTGEWDARWSESGIKPLAPEEMGAWLTRRDAVLTRLDELTRVEQERSLAENRVAELCTRLTGILGHEGGTFPELRREIGRLRDTRRKTEDDRTRLARSISEGEELIARHTEDVEAADTHLQTWREDWTQVVGVLGLAEDSSTAEAEAVLSVYSELRENLTAAEGLERQVDGIDRDSEALEETVAELVEKCAPHLKGLPMEEAADKLITEFHTGEKNRESAGILAGLIEDRKDELREAVEAREVATKVISRLTLAAGVSEARDLPAVEKLVEDARRLDRAIADLRSRILDESNQGDIEEIRTDLAEAEDATLRRQREEIEVRIADLRTVLGEQQEKIGAVGAELGQLDGSSSAAAQAAEAASELVAVRGHAWEYIRLHLARRLLERELERYRKEHQGPLVRRTGEIFAHITLGSFSGIETDFNAAGEPVLLCVRPGGARLAPDTALSSGTADQLYLSLRLASLEHYVEGNGPMPLILDDLFINFDDERTLAGLETLGELAARTQVLLFTHHARLRELAEEAIGDRLKVHHLA